MVQAAGELGTEETELPPTRVKPERHDKCPEWIPDSLQGTCLSVTNMEQLSSNKKLLDLRRRTFPFTKLHLLLLFLKQMTICTEQHLNAPHTCNYVPGDS